MRVNIICRNWRDDRVLPRFARYLADGLGWELTERPVSLAEGYYLTGYFEMQQFRSWPPARPTAALFTHREEEPPGNGKARLYDVIARTVGLRIAMSEQYAVALAAHGVTIRPPLPVERERFTIAEQGRRARPLVGLAGFTYKNRRKGEDLARALVTSATGQRVDWTATGRGWPVAGKGHSWAQMPGFYQALDIFVCTSRVEGGPMTVLEALACGVPCVVPRGVGLLDELGTPAGGGIERYPRGDAAGLEAALARLLGRLAAGAIDGQALRALTARHTVAAWCAAHADGVARYLEARAA